MRLPVVPLHGHGILAVLFAVSTLAPGLAQGNGGESIVRPTAPASVSTHALALAPSADPISNQLRQISGQLGQLRHIALANGHTQQGDTGDVKKQLALIDKNIQLLDEQLTDSHQASLQRLDALEATNRWLIAAVSVLSLLVFGGAIRGRRYPSRHTQDHNPLVIAETGLSAQNATPTVDTAARVATPVAEANPAVAATSTPLDAVDPGAATDIAAIVHFGALVEEDLQETHRAFIDAEKGFMKPADIKKSSS